MSTYGITRYGPPNLYGLNRPVTVIPGGPTLPLISNAYLIDPFTATPIDYRSVLLTWNGPDPTTGTPMNEFRLLSSRYGYPVDENDGNILLDTTSAPGRQFVDQHVVAGQMTYYGFYILGANSQWVRAGFAACLMPVNHNYASRLWSYLPEYLRDIVNGELTTDAAGDTFLSQYLQVAGWSLDYLKTQYDFLYANQNDPMGMSLADLAQLAGQLGMPFSAEIPAYRLRQAADNWATVMRERGSLAGVSEHIALLSGFGADIRLSPNVMLENDQSSPKDPSFPHWSAGIPYVVGEIVSWPVYPSWVASQSYIVNNYVVYNGVNYQCIATGGASVPPVGAVNSGTYWAIAAGPYLYSCSNAITSLPGNAPPAVGAAGTTPTGSNSNWTLVFDTADSTYLGISGLIGGVNTWEALEGSTPTVQAPANSLLEGHGTRSPSNWANDFSHNTFRVYNRGGSAQDMWLRSVSRQAADVTSGSAVPDPQLVVEHAIPVPQPGGEWVSTTRYGTGDVVTYGGQNYLALRASTGGTPPTLGLPLNENWDFETGVSPWAGVNGASVSQSNTVAYHGTFSMKMTFSGASTIQYAVSEQVTVTPNATYTGKAFAYSPAAWAGGVNVNINWWDAFGQYISTSVGTTVSLSAAAWTVVTVAGTAPASAATGQVVLQADGSPTGSQTIYWDLAKFHCSATPEWQPIGLDARVPLVISAQTSQNWSQATAAQYGIFPFVEWYDNWGNLITRAFARTPTAGTPGTPGSYAYDSFTTGPGTPLQGRAIDAGNQNWTVSSGGSWLTDGNGNVYPTSGVNPLAWVTAPLSCTQAVTFTEAPQPGQDTGLIFWRQASGVYWHAGTHGLFYYNNSTWTEAVTYATAGQLQPGDRIYVVTNQAATGSTAAILVYRNVIGAFSSATGNGQVASVTASAMPSGSQPAGGATVFSGIASEAV